MCTTVHIKLTAPTTSMTVACSSEENEVNTKAKLKIHYCTHEVPYNTSGCYNNTDYLYTILGDFKVGRFNRLLYLMKHHYTNDTIRVGWLRSLVLQQNDTCSGIAKLGLPELNL